MEPARTPGARAEEPAIADLSFRVEARFRPFRVVSPGFGDADLSEPAGGDLVLERTGPPAPFAAVEVEAARPSGAVVAGLASADEHVLARYDPATSTASIEVRLGDRVTTVRTRRARLPGSFTLGFALCENRVTVLATARGRTRPLLTERAGVLRLVDLRRPATLARLRYAWGMSGGSRPTRVRAGLFGMTGLRDLHLVQHADGTPYEEDGRLLLTATCAGLGSFRQAHWGVFALDPADPARLEQVAHLFSSRDGLVLGDHAGQLVRDGDRWHVALSSWGDFAGHGVHVRQTVTTADVLHGIHLLDTRPAPLPTGDGSWDPALTRIDGRWHVAFVESPSQTPFDFHPALAVAGPGDDPWEGLRLVGAATDLHHCEGPVLARLDGHWRLLASDRHAREYPVFDLALRRVGRLDAPYGSNIPHPQVVPLPDGGHLLVTFDGRQFAPRTMGYGGHGDVVVMRSRD